MVECIRNTLDRRVQFYEEEIRKLTEQRFMPVWNFCNFFILKESLAFMFEMAHLYEDALREYDELELCYLETGNTYVPVLEGRFSCEDGPVFRGTSQGLQRQYFTRILSMSAKSSGASHCQTTND
ncbi:trafficking protein particle complex II-specific subunit 130-like protein [Iris pallida]|uniref:Trafficking protein particle complex II-specific subunit 130-like protein n=1 Tax=Iris pallida TaxID=29817 RepID=A0AAX6GW23_IRIPA|nr:trafficking protein particle complex II-specific subunit 130-like protein [Iris pallida]